MPKILILILLVSNQLVFSQVKRREFIRYKNTEEKKLLYLPFKSGSIKKPVTVLLDQNLTKEIKNTYVFDIMQPGGSANTVAGALQAAMPVHKQGKMYNCPFVLKNTIELFLDKYIVKSELFSVERNEVIESYHQECACPLEEILFWMIPEIATKIGEARLELPTNCPEDMVLIKGGKYTAGSDENEDNNPKHEADVPNFCVDKYEFPNKAGTLPSANMNWHEARDSCLARGKRLCSEDEWERACRSQYNYIYSYGNQFNKVCNTHRGNIVSSGSKTKCRSPEGVFDMCGNLAEWTKDRWDPNLSNKVVRGGSFMSREQYSRCTFRGSNDPKIHARTIGFRCCTTIK
ncbi:MAG: formylglycine-generating enzyme family protein [Fibrobacterota bacterium]